MDNLIKNQKEIERKQKKLGKLGAEQKKVYTIVRERIAVMSRRQRIKLLKKRSAVDNLIAEVREELKNE